MTFSLLLASFLRGTIELLHAVDIYYTLYFLKNMFCLLVVNLTLKHQGNFYHGQDCYSLTSNIKLPKAPDIHNINSHNPNCLLVVSYFPQLFI